MHWFFFEIRGIVRIYNSLFILPWIQKSSRSYLLWILSLVHFQHCTNLVWRNYMVKHKIYMHFGNLVLSSAIMRNCGKIAQYDNNKSKIETHIWINLKFHRKYNDFCFSIFCYIIYDVFKKKIFHIVRWKFHKSIKKLVILLQIFDFILLSVLYNMNNVTYILIFTENIYIFFL